MRSSIRHILEFLSITSVLLSGMFVLAVDEGAESKAQSESAALPMVAGDKGNPALDSLGAYHVVWDGPSRDSHGSMPLGNGDIGIHAWVEEGGDLVFYVSKTDAWDENARLCKIGRVRAKFDPPLAVKDKFRQELKLRDGVIEVESQVQNKPAGILLWVDSDQPAVRVEAESAAPVRCRAELELWRLRRSLSIPILAIRE